MSITWISNFKIRQLEVGKQYSFLLLNIISFSFFFCKPYASKISQYIYLNLSECNENLYLHSRDMYLSHI